MRDEIIRFLMFNIFVLLHLIFDMLIHMKENSEIPFFDSHTPLNMAKKMDVIMSVILLIMVIFP